MRLRWVALAALLAAVPVLAGCATGASPGVAEATGPVLTVYSSLPLQGPRARASEEILGGEKLALREAHDRAGRFKVVFVSLDDAEAQSGAWSAGITETNARIAAQDTSTIAYIGDYDSGATAVSLPLTNGAGIPQVSPASPYVGLTSSLDAGQDEPERFYPSGRRTFVRLQPGDPVEAAAQVELMRSLRVHSVYVLDDENAFNVPLATLLANDAQHAGMSVPAHDSIAITPRSVFTEEVQKIVQSGAQAVFLAGEAGAGAATLFQQLHAADPTMKLLGSSAMASEAFTAQLGPAAASTFLTTPLLPARFYPYAAQRVLARYRRTFKREAGAEALYGYEAMSLVLGAIRAAGRKGDTRAAVSARLLTASRRNSVLGRYSMQPSGETTLASFAVDRVVHGKPVFERLLAAAGARG